MRANYEAIPSEDTNLQPSPLTPVGENHRSRSWGWVSSLRKAAAPWTAVALVLMGVSFVAKSIGLGCPHKMSVFQSTGLRGGEVWRGYHHQNYKNRFPPHHDEYHDDSDNSFDFYILSMSHQPEFCYENGEKPRGCNNPKQIWDRLTIHGLWPSNNDGSSPQTCSNEKFDLSSLQPIREELEQKWPNIKAPSRSYLWQHEWSKHGTCSGLSQLDYFSGALKTLMPTPSIVTDAEEQHTVVKKDDLLAAYGGDKRAVLVCWKHYLRDVKVCHQKETDGSVGERMDCPESMLRKSSCGSEIQIASFGM